MSFRDELLDTLLREPYARFTAGKRELMMRCPFCGDSIKHANSTHLYIKVDNGDDEPFVYYCQRCKTSGIIDRDFFKVLKVKDTSLLVGLVDFNKKATKGKKRYQKSLEKRYLKLPNSYIKNKRNLIKLNYINQRIGTELSLEDLHKYKIIIDLYDLLDENNIGFLTCKETMGNTLQQNFIGFVSFDNCYVIMRNLSTKVLPNMRYFNYNIFDMHDNSKRFYVIPTSVDLKNPNLTIVLCEGVFDILSVFFNIKKQETGNIIYAAVGGVGYEDVIKQLIRYTGCLNVNIEIYGDSDQPLKFYQAIIKRIPHLVSRFILYQNSLEKDFGVPIDRIKIKKTLIK